MKIAVATDFSDRSREALPVAASLARKFSAELFVVYQCELALLTSPPSFDVEQIFQAADEKLSGLIEAEPSFDGLEVVPLLVRGGNIRTFKESLENQDIDLLVVTTHGRTGVQRFLLGSFAEKTLRFAPCPVLVFRKTGKDKAESEDFAPRRILIPHDGSVISRHAVDCACKWARAFDAKARLLQVVNNQPQTVGFGPDILGGWHQYEEKCKHLAREELQSIAEAEESIEPEVAIRVGHPVLEILNQAEDYGADLIVMGTTGKTGLQHYLLGSVAEKTVREASCSVLVVEGLAKF